MSRVRRPLLLGAALAAALLLPVPGALAIVGGSPARVTDAPWLAQLEAGSGARREVVCGATVIAPRVALTAAHCLLFTARARTLRVVLGRQARGRGPFAEARTASGVSVDPVYLRLQPDNRGDLALVWWDRPVAAPPLALPARGSAAVAPGTPALTLGWGLRAGGRVSASLLQATLPLRSPGSCRRAYRRSGVLPNPTWELCAGATSRGRAMPCSGDSGGPLITGGAGVPALVGVVSWGDGRNACRGGLRPGMFARTDRGPGRAWLDRALATGRPRYTLPLRRSARVPVGAFARRPAARR
jgi:secreted trypsin-like serine protease